MIFPNLFSRIICGFMTAQVQLLNRAVVLNLVFSPKKKSISLSAEPANRSGKFQIYTRITSVDSVSNSFITELSSDTVGSLNSGNLAVGGTDEGSPFLDGVFGNQLQADDKIAADEFGELFEEWLALGNQDYGGGFTLCSP
jgi:hypothetical protein